MNYTYKELAELDTPILKELLTVFAEAFEDAETYQSNVPSNAYLHSFLSKQSSIVLVALNGVDVVGGLVAYELEKFEQERSEIYIYDLAVANAYRRQGIATGLIKKLKSIAQDRKAYVIYVQANKGDMPAIKLYESLGAKQDVHHFDIKTEN